MCNIAGIGAVEINEDLPNENKWTVYSELSIVRDSATIFVFGRHLKAARGKGKL